MKPLIWYHKELNRSFGVTYKQIAGLSTFIVVPTQKGLVWRDRDAINLSNWHSLLQMSAKKREPLCGTACHARVLRMGIDVDNITCNMVINMYSKCGLLDSARKVFDAMPVRSLVSWNIMIAAYNQHGEKQKAVQLFLEVQRSGIKYSEFTLSSVLCACAANGLISESKQLHAFAIKASMDTNVFMGTALLDVYAKCSLIQDASRVFEDMPERNPVMWSSMVSGYVQNELYEEALVLYIKGQKEGLENNQFTLSSVICACAALAALIEGKQVHAVIFKTGFGLNSFVTSSLIDLYAKCGSVKEAYTVFSDIEGKNIVVWNTMISGFAKHSCSFEVMILFEKMQQGGILPDKVTYVSILSACSHMGLVDKGRKYFDLMTGEHNVSPKITHYSCMVDILGRAGLIHEAYKLIKEMPFDATPPIWGSLLASCRSHGSVELAEIAAKNLFQMEPDNAVNYILLSNVYAAHKRWGEVANARKFLKENEVKKETGKSWIEIKNRVHTFVVGERNHPRINDIYIELDNLFEEMKKLGYKSQAEYDLHDVEDNKKQELLRHHSEKLAFTFGLMCLPFTAPIRIMKNLRICGDCHSFLKLASRITGRVIIVRDVNRFHHIKNGICSCKEFW
ncbi:hypothetical protein K2173_005688 [Erythroxylum novogranatense]|uniref:DYW domain-containing protein n=1 Tax=Erythroxylum novogranatense TaxID=1862640 RepID=A0AAV8SQH4_9ROSI|nr:hypothetical protein K2173_005688 [Erythroxylum novogranatense]